MTATPATHDHTTTGSAGSGARAGRRPGLGGLVTLVVHLVRARLRGWRLLGAAALVLAQPAVQVLAALADPPTSRTAAADMLLQVVAGSGVLVATAMVLLAASTLRDERDDETLPWLVLTPVPRWQVAAATTIAAVTACLALAAVSTVGLTIAGLLSGAGFAGASTWPFTVVAAVGYGSVGAAVGFLAPRGLMVMLAYVYVWEGAIGSLVPVAGNTSIWRISLSAWGSFVELPRIARDIVAPVTVGAGGAAVKVLGAAVVATVLLWVVLRRRDLV